MLGVESRRNPHAYTLNFAQYALWFRTMEKSGKLAAQASSKKTTGDDEKEQRKKIAFAVKQAKFAEVSRERRIRAATFYTWKQMDGHGPSELRRLKQQEEGELTAQEAWHRLLI